MTDQDRAGGPRRTRRQLLTGGTAALAAMLAAGTLARPAPAAAANGDNVILGQGNAETGETYIANSTSGVEEVTLFLEASGSATALVGRTGDGVGVDGAATGNGYGVTGETSSGSASGVLGVNAGAGNGVQGESSSGSASGVYGVNEGDGNGVYGYARNSAASGVYGQNDGTGYGVAGRAANGVGVLGDSASGTGVWANSDHATALKVTGTAQFSRSGVATVAGTSAAPRDSVRVSLPITSRSMMTALLQKHVAGVWVVAAVPNVPGGYFTIYLNKTVRTKVGPVTWMVTERP